MSLVSLIGLLTAPNPSSLVAMACFLAVGLRFGRLAALDGVDRGVVGVHAMTLSMLGGRRAAVAHNKGGIGLRLGMGLMS